MASFYARALLRVPSRVASVPVDPEGVLQDDTGQPPAPISIS